MERGLVSFWWLEEEVGFMRNLGAFGSIGPGGLSKPTSAFVLYS